MVIVFSRSVMPCLSANPSENLTVQQGGRTLPPSHSGHLIHVISQIPTKIVAAPSRIAGAPPGIEVKKEKYLWLRFQAWLKC
jgi:hypothetical protein